MPQVDFMNRRFQMIDFSNAFPERVRLASEAIAKQEASLNALNPFGGALDDKSV